MENVKIAQESMEKGELIVQMLEQFGLFWNVNKVKLITDTDGDNTGFYGIQREDTKKVFQCTTNQYQVLQNWELAEMVQEVAGRFDLSVSKGGMFNDGAKIYLQVPTGEITGIGDNNDTVKKYITAINSHDGSKSVGFGMTNVTISCSNTFHSAYKDMNKIRHSSSMKDRIDSMMRDFESIKMAEKTMYETFFKMSSVGATSEDIKKVVMMGTNVNLDVKVKEAEDVYSTHQLKQAKQLTGRIAEEMAVKGNSLWGLFSGVTKYTNRDIKFANRDNSTLESKFLGSAGRLDNKAYNLIANKL